GGSGVAMPGTHELNGDDPVVAGITFPNGSVQIAGDYNRVTRNLFTDFSRIAVGVSGGAYNRIDHNEFADMSSAGGERGYVAVNIGPAPNTTTTRGNRIDHNYFHDYPDWGMNGHEAIWLGSHMRQITIVTETLVDHNYFENIDSDGEIIKVTTDRNFL